MKYIKIFLASSIKDFKVERLQLSDFIRSLNDNFVRHGIYFELIICENVSNALHKERSQQMLNNLVAESQFFYVIIDKEYGKYTEEEFECALKAYNTTGFPKIYTYFHQLVVPDSPAEETIDFMKRLGEQLGHYYSIFTHIDSIKLNMLLELTKDRAVEGKISFQDGVALINGQTVLPISNVPVYEKNTLLQSIISERKQLEAYYEELLRMFSITPDNPVIKSMIDDNIQKRHALTESQHKIENEILDICASIVDKRQLGKAINWRERKAMEFIDVGDYENAKEILRDSLWKIEVEQAEHIIDNRKNVISEYISGKRTLIQTLSVTGIDSDTEREITDCYEEIISLAEKYSLEINVLYEYASFLMHHNNHEKAISIAKRLNAYYEYFDSNCEACADNKYLYACMLYKTNLINASESLHREALEIRRKLFSESSPVSMAKYAASCNQLGYLLFRAGKYAEAGKMYQEGIDILESISDDPIYLQNLALVLNNMGLLNQKLKNLNSALQYFEKSLELRKKLATDSNLRSLGFLAMSYLNYAKAILEVKGFKDADTYFCDAIEYYSNLCRRDTKYKIDYAIAVYYRAVALESIDTEEALKLHLEVLQQRKALYLLNEDALKADMARSCFSVGRLMLSDDYSLAIDYLQKSRTLWEDLYRISPEKFQDEYDEINNYFDSNILE